MTQGTQNEAKITATNNLLYKGKVYTAETVKDCDLPTHKLHERENKNTVAFKVDYLHYLIFIGAIWW